MKNKVYLTLIPSKNDAELTSNQYQEELKQFYAKFPKDLEIQPVSFAMDSILGSGGLFGEFILLAKALTSTFIKLALGWWLNGRVGRMIRLEVGNIKLEANNIDELDALIARAIFLQEHQSKLRQNHSKQ